MLILSTIVARSFATVYEQVVTSLTTCVLTDITQYKAKYARSQLREAFDLPPKKIQFDRDDDDGDDDDDDDDGSSSRSRPATSRLTLTPTLALTLALTAYFYRAQSKCTPPPLLEP